MINHQVILFKLIYISLASPKVINQGNFKDPTMSAPGDIFLQSKMERFPIEKVLGKEACLKMPIRTVEYMGIKKRLAGSWCAKEIFSAKNYKNEMLPCFNEQIQDHTMKAYKLKNEEHCTIKNAKYGKIKKHHTGKKTLCLGLNNVIMKIIMYAEDTADEVIEVINKETQQINEISIYYRPFLFEFLDEMKTKFELVIYCSLPDSYLNAIVNSMEKKTKYFSYRFGENFCIFPNYFFSIKTIDFLLFNRSLSDIIAVDTIPKEYVFAPDNFVPITRYKGKGIHDAELIKLASVLDLLYIEEDIRKGIKNLRETT